MFQHRAECEKKIHELLGSKGLLEGDKRRLEESLEDEKKKTEDVTFRYEEEHLSRGDLEVSK